MKEQLEQIHVPSWDTDVHRHDALLSAMVSVSASVAARAVPLQQRKKYASGKILALSSKRQQWMSDAKQIWKELRSHIIDVTFYCWKALASVTQSVPCPNWLALHLAAIWNLDKKRN